MDWSYANGNGNFKAICSDTDKDDREITVLPDALVLQTKVSYGMQSGTYGTSNLISRDHFAIINDSLKKSISRQTRCVLKLQEQD